MFRNCSWRALARTFLVRGNRKNDLSQLLRHAATHPASLRFSRIGCAAATPTAASWQCHYSIGDRFCRSEIPAAPKASGPKGVSMSTPPEE